MGKHDMPDQAERRASRAITTRRASFIPRRTRGRILAAAAAAGLLAFAAPLGTASAQDLVYKPINPSFGGNPFNSSHLLGIANLQDDFEDPDARSSARGTGRSSPAEIFARQLQSRLLSEVSDDIVRAIFPESGEGQDEGEVVFGDTTIRFDRGLSSVDLTIEDTATGQVTEISVPTLQP